MAEEVGGMNSRKAKALRREAKAITVEAGGERGLRWKLRTIWRVWRSRPVVERRVYQHIKKKG